MDLKNRTLAKVLNRSKRSKVIMLQLKDHCGDPKEIEDFISPQITVQHGFSSLHQSNTELQMLNGSKDPDVLYAASYREEDMLTLINGGPKAQSINQLTVENWNKLTSGLLQVTLEELD